jgi:hypothetical protein
MRPVAAIAFLLALCLLAGCTHAPPTPPPPSVPAAPALFSDVAESAGLHYQWTVAGTRPLNILQTIGNGCAFLDYDNDGRLDILLVGPNLALYKGDGQGHFTDATHQMGLDKLHGHFLGCAVGDYDGDGYDDIYLSGYRTGILLHNEKGKGFRDVTASAGLKPQPWGTSASFTETVPGSGKLDLFIANYAVFGTEPGIPQLCDSHGLKTSCGPRYYTPLKGTFYRNLGNGRFADVSAAVGMAQTSGRGLGVAFAPLEIGEAPSLAIADDELAGDLLRPSSKAAAHYANIGTQAGTAFDRDGGIHGGMGTDWGDYDNDGKFDLFVCTFQSEAKSLYHNEGNGLFTDVSYRTGLALPTQPRVAFGCKFFDYDNDGWLDLIIANGHVQDNIHDIDTSTTYKQTLQLFHNSGGNPLTFDETSAAGGPAFAQPMVGRGLAVGDYDNDGQEDALVVDSEGKPLLLHNECRNAGHWLEVCLIGTKSNRDGIGATLTAHVGGRSLLRLCHTDGSYLSASDKRVHFGLGTATAVDTLTIRWPSGQIDTLQALPADKIITVREGQGLVKESGKNARGQGRRLPHPALLSAYH